MDIIINEFVNWLDLIWVLVALVALHKGQRFKGVLFALMCVLALRLQLQLMDSVGFAEGWLGFIDFPLLFRGYVAYGAFIATFFALLNFSREKDTYIYLAAAITVFTFAFCVSMLVMVL